VIDDLNAVMNGDLDVGTLSPTELRAAIVQVCNLASRHDLGDYCSAVTELFEHLDSLMTQKKPWRSSTTPREWRIDVPSAEGDGSPEPFLICAVCGPLPSERLYDIGGEDFHSVMVRGMQREWDGTPLSPPEYEPCGPVTPSAKEPGDV
jgi:hypothetical protein